MEVTLITSVIAISLAVGIITGCIIIARDTRKYRKKAEAAAERAEQAAFRAGLAADRAQAAVERARIARDRAEAARAQQENMINHWSSYKQEKDTTEDGFFI
jgi:hypothetical protein